MYSDSVGSVRHSIRLLVLGEDNWHSFCGHEHVAERICDMALLNIHVRVTCSERYFISIHRTLKSLDTSCAMQTKVFLGNNVQGHHLPAL